MKRKRNRFSTVIFLATAWVLSTVPSLQAIEGFWVNSNGGNWNDAGNWTNTAAAPNGVGHTAWLTEPLTAERVVSLQEDVTLGRLVVENDGYKIGASTVTQPELIFDNGASSANLVFVNDNAGRTSTAKFYHPIVVSNRLDCRMVDAGNMSLYFVSGFIGDANAVLDFTYQLSSGENNIELRSNQGYIGTVNLRRVGTVAQSLGIRFYNADAIFAGGAGSIRVHPGVTLNFRSALTDAEAARFAFVGDSHNVVLNSSGSFKDLANPGALVPQGGQFHLNHETSTVIPRYKNGADMPLNNTYVVLTGYNTAPGRTNEEYPGTLSLVDGNRIYIQNRSRANSIAGMHFSGFSRAGNATCTFRGSGRGEPLGATESNRVTFASGLPAETNGILPPYLVYFDSGGSTIVNGMFMKYGPNGMAIFDDFQATNSFDLGASAVVHVTSPVDLGGVPASCHALRGRAAVSNGDLTIQSGGLILGGSFQYWTANLFFGENGTGNAYVHMDGHIDRAKVIRISGAIHCQDFVKFGAQTDLCLTASNAIAGNAELQDGGLVVAHQYALGSDVDLEMGIRTRFDLKTGAATCEIGGLRSRGRATVRPNGKASETLVIHPAANTTNVFNGSLSNVNGILGVTVAGAGRQVFNGVSDYTGDTVVESGATLLLGDDGVLGATEVSVAGGATFGGTGSTAGALVLDDGAKLKLTPGTPLRVASLDAVTDASVTIDVSENASFSEGPVLTWSGAGPAAAPDFELGGAPSASRGAYEAVFDAEARQVAVALVFPPATTIIVR